MKAIPTLITALLAAVVLTVVAVPAPAEAASFTEAQKACKNVKGQAYSGCIKRKLNESDAPSKAVGPDAGTQGKAKGKCDNKRGAEFDDCIKNLGQNTKGDNEDPVSGKKVKDTSVVDYINSAYRYSAVFGGLIAVLMLIYAGYRYMTSYGDPEKIADAKDIIEKSLLGLGLLIVAALILQTINPATINPNQNKNPGEIDFTKPGG